MAKKARKDVDAVIESVRVALSPYQEKHPKAKIDIYRYSPVSIRIRILDPDFAGVNRLERHEIIWPYLTELPEETVSDITLVLLLTPKERKTSIANYDFEHPLPLNSID